MKTILKALAAGVSLVALGAGLNPARADVFTYTYTSTDSSGLSGTLVLDADLISPGVFAIVGGSDTAIGGTDSALDGIFMIEGGSTTSFNTNTYLSSPSGLYIYNNLVSPAAAPTFLDVDGLLFGDPAMTSEINIWGNPDGTYTFNSEIAGVYETPAGVGTSIVFSFVSDIPEPVSLAIFGSGLAGILLARRPRRVPPGAAKA